MRPEFVTHLDSLMGFSGFEGFGGVGGGAGLGWVNELTGMGTSRDKTTHARFMGYRPTDLFTLANMYHGHDLSARIVNTLPEEAFRLPFKISCGTDALDTWLADEFERLEVRDRILESWIWGRLFGGAWTVLGIDDGLPASEPLKSDRAASVDWLQVVDRRFMWPLSYYEAGPKAGTPDRYVLSQVWVGVPQGAYVIHESRMVRWGGVRTAQRERNLNASYDYSILDRAWQQLRTFETLWRGIELLITEGPQAVYKMKDLAQKMGAGQEMALRTRVAAIEQMRSIMRAVIIDADAESFERQNATYTGLDKIVTQCMLRVCATAEAPMMILFGEDPGGLGNGDKGIGSLRWFWDRTASAQKNVAAPRMLEIARHLLTVKGRADVASKVKITWDPLYTPTALEQAQERLAIAQADNAWITGQVLTPEEAALSHFKERGEFDRGYGAVEIQPREAVLEDVMRNMTEGSKPGAPLPEDVGKTPTTKDVRGFGMPELPVQVDPKHPTPASAGGARGNVGAFVAPTSKQRTTIRKDAREQAAILADVKSQLRDDYDDEDLMWLDNATWEGPMEVPLDKIDFSNKDAWRASGEPGKVDDFADKIQKGRLKPIILVKEPGKELLGVADGHHRALADKKLDRPAMAYIAKVPRADKRWKIMHTEQRTASIVHGS